MFCPLQNSFLPHHDGAAFFRRKIVLSSRAAFLDLLPSAPALIFKICAAPEAACVDVLHATLSFFFGGYYHFIALCQFCTTCAVLRRGLIADMTPRAKRRRRRRHQTGHVPASGERNAAVVCLWLGTGLSLARPSFFL